MCIPYNTATQQVDMKRGVDYLPRKLFSNGTTEKDF